MKVNKPIDLKKQIEQKVSPEQVFRFYYPYEFRLNDRCRSCFTERDANPSMVIGTKSQTGEVIFKCFNSHHKGDFVSFVMQYFNLDYREALEKIAIDFGIKEDDGKKYQSIISSLPITKDVRQKKAPDIVVATRPFNSEELRYWNEYYQDLEDLKRENIFVPKKIWVNKNPIILKSTELCFAYYYPDIDKWKLYRPFEDKIKKWYTNVNFDFVENINKLQGCDKVLIAKSKKDKMVLQKALNFECMITTQAEDFACFNEQAIEILKTIPEVYTVFDNDTKGKAASWILTNNFGFKHCNVPDKYLKEDITDFADLAKSKGLWKVQEHFKNKKII